MKKAFQTDKYETKVIGSFGQFSTSESFPIDYVLTSFAIHQADGLLTFARDLGLTHIDFELLMQRDIDEERVRERILKYLTEKGSKRDRPLFFPPLLIAILPVEDGNIRTEFENPTIPNLEECEAGQPALFEWPGCFKLEAFIGDGKNDQKFNVDQVAYSVDREQAMLHLNLSKSKEYGCKLVVIDGQHRLMALKKLYNDNTGKKLIENLSIPICILFPPDSTKKYVNSTENYVAPKVTDVFRTLFVDVNNTVERVGGHFTILLSDKQIDELACRNFCEHVLEERGLNSLALVEWNEKVWKDRAIVKQPHSVTSIGIISESLKQGFRTRGLWLFRYLLQTSEISDELNPEGADEEFYPPVKWDNFSIVQRPILDTQVRKYLIPTLDKMFFEYKPFAEIVSVVDAEIKSLDAEADGSGDEAIAAENVLDFLVQYKPLPDNRGEGKASHQRLRKFNEACTVALRPLSLVRTARFQQGMIDSLIKLCHIADKHQISLEGCSRILQSAVETLFDGEDDKVGWDRSYMQNTIYQDNKIKAKLDTLRAISQLISGQFSNEALHKNLVEELELSSRMADDLMELGWDNCSQFLLYYKSEKIKRLRGGFKVDQSLTIEQRSDLAFAENQFMEDKIKAAEGKIKESEISREFERLLEDYSTEFVQEAKSDFEKAFNVESLLVLAGEQDEDLAGNSE